MNQCPKCGADNPPFNNVCRLCDVPLSRGGTPSPSAEEVMEVLPADVLAPPPAGEVLDVLPMTPDPPNRRPAPAVVDSKESGPWATVGLVFLRIGQTLLGLFLILLIVQMFQNGYRISEGRFEMRSQYVHGMGWVPMPTTAAPAPFSNNGTFLTIGLLLIGALLFVLNAMFRRRNAAVGWLDRMLGKAWFAVGAAVLTPALMFLPLFLREEYGNQFWGTADGAVIPHVVMTSLIAAGAASSAALLVFIGASSCRHAALPAGVVSFAAVCLLLMLPHEWKWHADPAEALPNLIGEKGKVYQAGNLLYRQDDGDQVHLVPITPDLVRALDRKKLSLDSQHDLPLPGVVPVAFALVVGVGVMLGRWRWPERADAVAARGMAIFALAHLFVVWWLLAASARGLTVGGFALLPILSLALLGLHWSKRRNPALTPAMSAGWVTLFFAFQLALLAAIYLPIDKQPGSPLRWWIWTYVAAAGVLWLTTLPRKSNSVLTVVPE